METITSQPVMLEDADLDLVTGGQSTNVIGGVGGAASIGDYNYVDYNYVDYNYAYYNTANYSA